jgi:hypothetical protein
LEQFFQRALAVLRACMGGPDVGRPFLIVLLVSLVAFVVTLEHVGLIVGMKRYSGLRAWVTGLVSFSVLLFAGTFAHGFALSRDMSPEHAQILAILAAVCAALLVAVPFLSYAISVSYLGGVCALGLGVISSLIVGKVATESVRNFRSAARGEELPYTEARGIQRLWSD